MFVKQKFLVLIGALYAGISSNVCGKESMEIVLEKADRLMESIYKTGDFMGADQAKSFHASWQADSATYSVTDRDSEKRVTTHYDVVTGERVVSKGSEDKEKGIRRGTLNMDWRQGVGQGGLSPDGRYRLDFKAGNLRSRAAGDGATIMLTGNADGDSINNQNAIWSPDSKWIAFMEYDRSAMPLRATLEPTDPTYPEVRHTRYSRVGEAISKARVGVVDPGGKAIRWHSIPEPAEGSYLGGLSWAGNSHELFIEKLSRGRDKREFLIIDIHTGNIKVIFEESDPAWIAGAYETDAGPVWVRDHRAFIVMSDRDGWRRSYLYGRDGKELGVLTPGEVDVMKFAALDEAGGWYYYYASPDNATQLYLYRSNLDGSGKSERVTPTTQAGTHQYEISPDLKWAFHTYSTFDRPPVTELVRFPSHETVRVLEDNKALRAKVKSWMAQPTEFFQVDIGDGVMMDGYMLKPRDFDPGKKYPMFIYTYSEPYAQEVLDKWRGTRDYYHRAIAEMGYLVVCMDTRGTPAPKGTSWRKAEFPTLGILSTDDQAAGVRELGRTRSYVDLTRVGIWGWSGGGSNTLNALFRKPDVYSLGIAVVPKPQPHLYNAWFQEIFMRTLKDNEEGYRKSAPINYAEGLEGNLLIITGTGETNTHVQIVEGLVDRLITLDKKFDYFTYPHRDHGLSEGKGTVLHLRKYMLRYLLTHMPAGPR
jgi:dipeptidyl-peptidase-4